MSYFVPDGHDYAICPYKTGLLRSGDPLTSRAEAIVEAFYYLFRDCMMVPEFQFSTDTPGVIDY